MLKKDGTFLNGELIPQHNVGLLRLAQLHTIQFDELEFCFVLQLSHNARHCRRLSSTWHTRDVCSDVNAKNLTRKKPSPTRKERWNGAQDPMQLKSNAPNYHMP